MSERNMGGPSGGRYPRPESKFRKTREEAQAENLFNKIDQQEEVSPGLVLKALSVRLDQEAKETLFLYAKTRNLLAIRNVVKKIGQTFPEYKAFCEVVNEKIFNDGDSVDWTTVDKDLGLSQ
ncbi:MAG: hypothetical protein NT034_04240 [Candidatus Magasanikbacteria bacterium]|nr:hypothetical protein [Candidatus Magasanikbacteria bacterium]